MPTTTFSLQPVSRSPASGSSGPPSHGGDDDDLTRELVLAHYDPAYRGTTSDLRRGIYLAALIYSLDDPWRSRFVDLIARRSRGRPIVADDPDGRRQLAIWLADQSLARMVRVMLRTWMHEV